MSLKLWKAAPLCVVSTFYLSESFADVLRQSPRWNGAQLKLSRQVSAIQNSNRVAIIRGTTPLLVNLFLLVNGNVTPEMRALELMMSGKKRELIAGETVLQCRTQT